VLVTSRLEHPSVTRVAEALEREGSARVRWLRVTEEGRVDLADVERALAEPDVALLALQAANHETGALQPVREALAMARARGVRVHVDAVQAFGKVDETGPDADTRSLAAHKLRGPKGIGALVSLCGTPLAPMLLGGAQERGLRPGTVDPVAAAGLAVAARHALGGAARHRALAARRDALVARLAPLGGGARAIGAGPRAPHVANLAWPGWAGAELVAALDLEGVSVSSGSACSAGTIEPSPVIAAMLGEAVAAGAVRISLGEATTDAELEHAIAAFTRVLARATEP
jgi:cysteine desulfurase